MTDRTRTASAFRLDLAQQKKRAKELLRAAQSGEPSALARLGALPGARARGASGRLKLADAQLAIARELRFPSWARLKAHTAALHRERSAIEGGRAAPDGGLSTLHIRCGSDIRETLREAGFVGDFFEHSVPYCLGPVTRGPDRHERMARFLVQAMPEARGGLVYERVLAGLKADEQRLDTSAEAYERVVLWMEDDSWDQLVLVRLLAHYAVARCPGRLELIAVDEFPGGARFIGIGQLPPEGLRLLWPTRRPVTNAQLALGLAAWTALSADDPRRLSDIMRSGTPALPILAPALHRHLRELPAVLTGLSLTQQLLLQILSEGDTTLQEVLLSLNAGREPLPWIGDLGLTSVVNDMLQVNEPVLLRTAPPPGSPWLNQQLAITQTGRAVLEGRRDWLSLSPPHRWVGGVEVGASSLGWRWDELRREPLLT